MPIKPENRGRYPKNWKQIRNEILDRAEHRCEECGVANYSYRHTTRIVLTVAHLNHTPEDCRPENLRAWCQRCHLAYDRAHHQINSAATRRARKQTRELF